VQFCQCVANLYPHTFTNFGRFILICNKMALIVVGVLSVFNVKFRVSSSQIAVTSSPMMSGPQFTRPQSTGLLGLREMLQSYYKLQPKLKQCPSLQIHFSWFDLLCRRKPLTNTVKDYRKRLQACVSVNGGNFEYIMWKLVKQIAIVIFNYIQSFYMSCFFTKNSWIL